MILAGAGQKRALLNGGTFPQQINPFNNTPGRGDKYGPMILSMLEYTALTTGIAVRANEHSGGGSILWSSVQAAADGEAPTPVPMFNYTQQLGSATFTLESFHNGSFVGLRNGVRVFECLGNTRVVTSVDGSVTSVVGVAPTTQTVVLSLHAPGTATTTTTTTTTTRITVAPNEEWAVGSGGTATLVRKTPFIAPFGVTPTNCTQGSQHDSCVP